MADEVERVEYVFEGDVSTLRTATTDAIGLLKQFETAMQKTASSVDFKASKTSVSAFNSAISATITQVNTLVKALNKLEPDAVESLAPQISGIQSATDTLQSTLEFLDGGLVSTSKDFKELTGYVRDAKTTFEAAASKAYGMATSYKQLETLSSSAGGKIQSTTQTAAEATSNFADIAGYNLQRYREEISRIQALDFASSISSQYNKISKSARESAEVLASVSNEDALTSAYGSAFGKIIDKTDQCRAKLSLLGASIAEQWQSVAARFDPIVAKIQSVKDRAASAMNRVSNSVSTCAAAFRRLVQGSEAADASAAASAKSHRSLGRILSGIASKFRKETEAISDEDKKLDDKNSTLRKSTSEHGRLSQALKRLGNLFNQERSSLNNLTSRFTRHNRVLGITKRLFAGITGLQLAKWFMNLAYSSAEAIEHLNLFTVAMGDSLDRGLEFVKQMQEIYGMDPSNLYRYAGYFYQLTDAIGMSDKASTSLSLSLTKASNDIASLFNVPIEQVVENLASGMQGMSRAVRKYGMDIRATTLQQTAAEYGLTQQVETMSEANRMALRYITMLKQVQNALKQTGKDATGASAQLGDFARNIETPANQLRIFKEQLSQLGRAIGNFLIVPIQKSIAYINGFVMALRIAINFIGSSLKILQTNVDKVDAGNVDDVASSVAGVGNSAKDAAKKVQNLLSPFDELNILKEESADADSGGTGFDNVLDPSLEKAIEDMELKLDNIRMKANQVRDALLEFFGFQVDAGEIIKWHPEQFEDNLINKFPQWTKTIQATFEHWGEIVDGFKAVFKALGGVVNSMKKKVLDFFKIFINDDSVSQFISDLGGNLQNLADWITQHENGIANFALTLTGLWGAFKLFGGVATLLKPVITTISIIVKILASLGSVFSALVGFINPVTAAIAAVVGIFALAYTQFESVRKATKNLSSSFKQMADNVSEAFTALWNDIFKPVLNNIVSGLKELWSKHLSKLVEEIGLDVAAIIDFVMSVVGVVSKLITFLSSTFGPIVSTVINTVVDLFSTLLGAVSDVVTRLLAVLRGLITFITGVFQGDWSKAWNGIVTVFKTVFGLIKDILKGVINVCVDLLNGLVSAVWNAVRGIINGVGTIVQQIGKLLGKKSWGWKLTAQPPKIPHLKTGGVVTGPTYALVGEGGKDEAVIPLDNSPQMAQLVQQIADAVRDIPRGGGSGSTNQPIEVRVFLDSREITSAQNRNNRMYGKNTQNV